MKLALLTAIATLALAVPAAADDATLEGYGGDGALLVGIDDSGPKFGNDPAPGNQPKPNDGNLVAEKAPSSSGGTQGVTVTPTQPSTAPAPTETTTEPARDKKRQQQRDERRRESRDKEPGSSPNPAPEPPREPAPLDAESSSGGAGLPFTGNELILLLAGLLGLAAIGAGMRRLLVLQPRV